MTQKPGMTRLERMETPRRLEHSSTDRVFVVFVAAVVGAVLAVGLPLVSTFAAEHDLPFPTWLQSVARLDATWLSWGRPVIGLAVGSLAGLLVIDQSWRLDITRERIVARQGNEVRRIPRERVGVVYRTGRRTVVIEAGDGVALFKGTVEGERSAVPEVFMALGYPWEGEV